MYTFKASVVLLACAVQVYTCRFLFFWHVLLASSTGIYIHVGLKLQLHMF